MTSAAGAMVVAVSRFCRIQAPSRTLAACGWRHTQEHRRYRSALEPASTARDGSREAVKFDSPEVATAGKTVWEVFRGWMVFKLFTYDFPVDHSMKVCFSQPATGCECNN